MGSQHLPQEKPLLFFTSFPGEGHTNPILSVASALVKRGHEVVYLCTAAYKTRINDAGAEFIEIPVVKRPGPKAPPAFLSQPTGVLQLALQLSHVFYKSLPERSQIFSDALATIRARHPGRRIIIFEDGPNMGVMPFKFGRPLPAGFDELPKTIGISPVPLMLPSKDTAPFMLGLPPDSTESGRLRNQALNKLILGGPMKPLVEAWQEALKQSGCTVIPEGNPLESWFTVHDAMFMLCSPSLEYPLSDLPATIQFAGCLPRGITSPSFKFPAWWPEVVQEDNAPEAKKKVLFVSQGTVRHNWAELVRPTMRAFVNRDDVIVVAALGRPGDKLEEDIEVPANTRVIDYVPYDTILEFTDVFISNAGYGAFGHAVKNGVPAVFAGESEDKLEVTMRAEWAGFAGNLRTQTPTPEQVRAGVDEILANPKYKNRAVELRKENEERDAISMIERQIVEYTERL